MLTKPFLKTHQTSCGLSKICTARALIRNPRILILDDAISGFDIDSEMLYDALPDIALEEQYYRFQ